MFKANEQVSFAVQSCLVDKKEVTNLFKDALKNQADMQVENTFSSQLYSVIEAEEGSLLMLIGG